jgi:hypothetical protein
MEAEKKEQTREETGEIVVLDAGIGNGDGPDSVCCCCTLTPLRW